MELLKSGQSDELISQLSALCTAVLRTGKWPSDWKTSIYLPIFKKGSPLECSNYRTIALISHTSKILLHIIRKRMEKQYEEELSTTQAGFRRDSGTRNGVLNLQLIY